MPGGNRTGPNGEGPKTGRGLGYCSGSETPGYTNEAGGARMGAGRGLRSGQVQGFGNDFRAGGCFRTGRGFGRGRGRGFRSAVDLGFERAGYSPEAEVGYLENRLNSLKQEIVDLTKQLSELGRPGPEQPSKKE